MADLEIRVRAEAQQAQATLDRLTQSVNGVARSAAGLDSGIAQAERAMAGMSRSSLLAGQDTERLDDAIRETGQTATTASGQVVTASESMKTALSGVAMAATQAIVGFLGFQKLAGMFSDTVRRLDELNESALAFGISGKTFSEFAYTLEQNGASVRDLEMALRGLSNSLEEAGSDKGSRAAKVFGQLGVSVKTLSGDMRPLEDVFLDAVDALSEVESASQRAALAQDLLKVRNAALLPIIAQGRQAFEDGAAAANKYGAAIDEEVLGAADRLGDELTNLKMLGASVFLPLIEGAGKAVEALNNVIVALRESSKGQESVLARGGGIISESEAFKLTQIFDSLPKSMQIQIEGLDQLEDRIRRLQSISVERRIRELPADDQTKIREQVRTFKAEESQLPRRVEEYKARLVEEAEARIAKARGDSADATIRAASAEEARVRLLEELVREQGPLPRPELAFGETRPLTREETEERTRLERGVAAPADILGGQPTGPGGIQSEKERAAAIKEQERVAAEAQKALQSYNRQLADQGGALDQAEDALQSFSNVARALGNTVLETAAAIAKLAIDLIQLIRSLSGTNLAQGAAGVANVASSAAAVIPAVDKGTTGTQGAQFNRAIRNFEDSVDTFDAGTRIFQNTVVTGGSRATTPRVGAASFAAPAGGRLSGVAPVGGAGTQMAGGLLGRVAQGFGTLLPFMAIGSQVGGIMDTLTGNAKARADLERFAADFNRQVTMGGPDLVDAQNLQRRQGYIEQWSQVAPDHAASGGWEEKEGGAITPYPAPEEPTEQRGTASVNINVSTLDSRSTAEFFKSDEYVRALNYARMVKAAD